MAEVKIMKAVEWDKLSAAFKKKHGSLDALRVAGFWLQKKYDGCFGMAILKADGTAVMRSRTAEDYTTSCTHILAELRGRLQVDGRNEGVILGELWNAELPFPTISGMFRQQRMEAAQLGFVANDLLPMTMETGRPYHQRLRNLQSLIYGAGRDFQPVSLMVAESYGPGEWNDAKAAASQWKAEGGYDGAILRDPDAGYTIGLVKNGEIIKVKPALSLDLQCTGYKYEPGEKTGREVLTLQVKYKDAYTWVGSGIPHSLKHTDAVMRIVEIECMDVTEDGLLREPRFKGVRIDKTEPDA